VSRFGQRRLKLTTHFGEREGRIERLKSTADPRKRSSILKKITQTLVAELIVSIHILGAVWNVVPDDGNDRMRGSVTASQGPLDTPSLLGAMTLVTLGSPIRERPAVVKRHACVT